MIRALTYARAIKATRFLLLQTCAEKGVLVLLRGPSFATHNASVMFAYKLLFPTYKRARQTVSRSIDLLDGCYARVGDEGNTTIAISCRLISP